MSEKPFLISKSSHPRKEVKNVDKLLGRKCYGRAIYVHYMSKEVINCVWENWGKQYRIDTICFGCQITNNSQGEKNKGHARMRCTGQGLNTTCKYSEFYLHPLSILSQHAEL